MSARCSRSSSLAKTTATNPHLMPKTNLTRIIRPRVEEIVELVRDRLVKAGFGPEAGRRIILTGGGAQLSGLTDMVRRVLSPHVRIGRPVGVQGLPDSAKSPAFAATVGMLIYPQFARIEHFEPTRSASLWNLAGGGYIGRVGTWLRESF